MSKKVFILVDNQPWLTSSQSRSAKLWQFMVTKVLKKVVVNSQGNQEGADSLVLVVGLQYRMSPFTNSRARSEDDTSASSSSGIGTTGKPAAAGERWFAAAELMMSRSLHGFLVFEVAWRDVHGINYLNELLTDTSLALEARRMNKWEFFSADQAAACAHLWFLGRAAEARALRAYLAAIHAGADPTPDDRTCSSSSLLAAVSEDADLGPTPRFSSPTTSSSCPRPTQYTDTLLLFRFRDSLLPLKLQQIVMSDIRLLTLLESGLPAWVIFLQSYPLVCHVYRPWMRPLARSLYLVASLATVLIGFYDLYKNVPLLKHAASRICGPLFGWIERWDMVTRIQYLGTILFLRNIRRFTQSLLALLRTATALLRALLRPLADAAGPLLSACAGLLSVLGPVWALLVDVAEAVWAPFDLVFDHVVACLWPLLQVLMLPLKCAVKLAGCMGSVMSAVYDFGKDIWETVSSIFELNHMSEAQQSAFDMSLLKNLWSDLFSQV